MWYFRFLSGTRERHLPTEGGGMGKPVANVGWCQLSCLVSCSSGTGAYTQLRVRSRGQPAITVARRRSKKMACIALMAGVRRSSTSVRDSLIPTPTLSLLHSLTFPAAGCCRQIFSSPPSSSSVISFLQFAPLSHTVSACQAHAMTSRFPGLVRSTTSSP